ncbi:MAG TPA: EF-P lysine aminoacylase GenX, partial [Gammaproteobacteria bacterium]|nr:EF-P lysine aminoacylase GenX [Gammaproteobacteria bacterium]
MNLDSGLAMRKQALQGRARLYRDIRAFFQTRGVLEVETPVFSQSG